MRTEQLSLLEWPLPPGAARAWGALDAEQRARLVSMLARLMARTVVDERDPAADEEKKSHG